jgi:hypothetical protein
MNRLSNPAHAEPTYDQLEMPPAVEVYSLGYIMAGTLPWLPSTKHQL